MRISNLFQWGRPAKGSVPFPVRVAAAALLGAVAAAGFAPVENCLMAALGLTGLFFMVAEEKSPRRAAFLGWMWGTVYFSIGLSWTYRALSSFGGLPSAVAVAGIVVLGMGLAIQTAVFSGVSRWIPCSDALRLSVVMPGIWFLTEWLRGVGLAGFGWLSVGYAFSDNLLVNWAPLVGCYGVGWAVASLCGTGLAFMTEKENVVVRSYATIGFAALAVASVYFGEVSWYQKGAKIEVRVVQPALPVVMQGYWGIDQERLQRVQAMSEVSALGRGLDLIVWPESVYATPLQRLGTELMTPVDVAQKMQATVLFNGFDEPVPGTYFNAVWQADPGVVGLKRVYAKRHLVPFGEFVPLGFRWFVNWLGIPMADQKRGGIPGQTVDVNGVAVAPLVCYENMFGEEVRDWWIHTKPELFVDTANLSWFSPWVLGQFTQMSVMRARETARPVIQAVNAGGSLLISADGRIERQAGAGAQNFDLQVVAARGEPTLFVQWGNTPLMLLICLSLMLIVSVGAIKRRRQFQIKT